MGRPKAAGWGETIVTVALWYLINVGITLLNPVLVVKYGFHYPIFLTGMHMAATTVLANAAVIWGGVAPRQSITSAGQMGKIALLALVQATGVVAGIAQARYITVSFEQTVSATTPLFTAVAALLFGLPPESARTYCFLVLVVGGLALASGFEPLFNWTGFLLAVFATATRALRSVLQQVLISGDNALEPLNVLRFNAPAALCMLLPAAMVLEGWEGFFSEVARGGTRGEPGWMALWLVISCCSAFLVNLFNQLVTRCTSAITLQVLGNMKGATAAMLSIPLFGRPVSGMSLLGLAATIAGVMLYSESKRREKQAGEGAGGGGKKKAA